MPFVGFHHPSRGPRCLTPGAKQIEKSGRGGFWKIDQLEKSEFGVGSAIFGISDLDFLKNEYWMSFFYGNSGGFFFEWNLGFWRV